MTMYKDLADGSLFRILPEAIYDGPHKSPRIVHTDGVFLKIGNSHAVRVQAGMERIAIIPALKAQCVPVPARYDVRYEPEWWVSHKEAL